MQYLYIMVLFLDERLINEWFFVNLDWQCWGCSSFGRARRSQRRGSEFDPRQLHHFALIWLPKVSFYLQAMH